MLAVLTAYSLLGSSLLLAQDDSEIGVGSARAVSPPPSQAPQELEALMRAFAESGVVRARFRETRTLALLVAPVESQGVLYFAPPDRLARVTQQPEPSSVVVRGSRAAMKGADGFRVFDLASNDVARDMVGTLVTVLSGDLTTLRERHSVSYRSGESGWTLELVPRSRSARRVIEWIRFGGLGSEVTSMERREANGDTTLTELHDVEMRVELSAAELELIFSLDAPSDTQ